MIGMTEISACHIWYQQCLKALKMFPGSQLLQYNAAKAQAQLVLLQAEYFASIRR